MKAIYSRWVLFGLFLAAIPLFAALYYYCDCLSVNSPNKALTALYLSMSTITTLGYGDVVIKDEGIRLWTSLQSILGLVLMGLMLNSFWHKHAQKIEEAHIHQQQEDNLRALNQYSRYLSIILAKYENAFAYLTSQAASGKPKYRQDFKLSSMAHMFGSTLSYANSFNDSRLLVYQKARKELMQEFKYILSNFELKNMESISANITIFLCANELMSVIDNLQSSPPQMKKMISEDIANRDIDTPPDITRPEYQSNLITPAIVLFKALKDDYCVLENLKKAFKDNGIDLEPPKYLGAM